MVRAVDRPVNVLAGSAGQTLSAAELTALGVRRVSVGGFLSSVAYGALIHAAEEMRSHGTFEFVGEAKRARRLKELLGQGAEGGQDDRASRLCLSSKIDIEAFRGGHP